VLSVAAYFNYFGTNYEQVQNLHVWPSLRPRVYTLGNYRRTEFGATHDVAFAMYKRYMEVHSDFHSKKVAYVFNRRAAFHSTLTRSLYETPSGGGRVSLSEWPRYFISAERMFAVSRILSVSVIFWHKALELADVINCARFC
jgi:hypothetical protein